MSLMKVKKTIEQEFEGLGAKIKAAREADGRSLTQICASSGMTAANWYRIEGEEVKSLPLETLRKIELVLEVDLGVYFETNND